MTQETTTVEIDISEHEAGSRIDRFLGNRFYPTYSRSFLTGLISSGLVTVNDTRVRPAYRIGKGDRIKAVLEPITESSPEPEPIPLEILHEDEFILIVNKPDGMIVHPGPGTRSGTLVNALLHHDPEIAKVGVVFRPGIVHRLDGNTSGVMVVARTNHARAELVEQFKTKRVKKEYRAMVVGVMPFDSDYIDLPIGPDTRHRDRMRVDPEAGKPSSTFYQVIERFQGATLVAAMPYTGRTHQIRVHLAQIGYPVMADPVYGRRYSQGWFSARQQAEKSGMEGPAIRRHALHAFRLSLDHPVTGERLSFEAPIPPDMQQLIDWYRNNARSPEEGDE